MIPETPSVVEFSEGELLTEVRNWVETRFLLHSKSPHKDIVIEHLNQAADFVREIDPEADINVVLAAQVHDVERAFPSPKYPSHPQSGYTQEEYQKYEREHSKRSARIACRFLRKMLGLPEEQIDDIRSLIQAHETGGDYRENLVQAADSISFLKVNASLFISWIPDKRSWREVKNKINLMYNRIQIPEAKEIAKPLYLKAINELDKKRPHQFALTHGEKAFEAWRRYLELAMAHDRAVRSNGRLEKARDEVLEKVFREEI